MSHKKEVTNMFGWFLGIDLDGEVSVVLEVGTDVLVDADTGDLTLDLDFGEEGTDA